jgi:hypothetical protein
VSDISDHFFTFTSPSHTKQTNKLISRTAKNFCNTKIESFKLSLQAHNWASTYSCNIASDSFANFWQDFKSRFDSHFPLQTFKVSKNSTCANNFLTPELLDARKKKLSLYKLSISNPSPTNTTSYKAHRNLYNTAVRQAKAIYHKQGFTNYAKISQKLSNS